MALGFGVFSYRPLNSVQMVAGTKMLFASVPMFFGATILVLGLRNFV